MLPITNDYYYSINDKCIKCISDNTPVTDSTIVKNVKIEIINNIMQYKNYKLNYIKFEFSKPELKPIYRFPIGTFEICETPFTIRKIIVNEDDSIEYTDLNDEESSFINDFIINETYFNLTKSECVFITSELPLPITCHYYGKLYYYDMYTNSLLLESSYSECNFDVLDYVEEKYKDFIVNEFIPNNIDKFYTTEKISDKPVEIYYDLFNVMYNKSYSKEFAKYLVYKNMAEWALGCNLTLINDDFPMISTEKLMYIYDFKSDKFCFDSLITYNDDESYLTSFSEYDCKSSTQLKQFKIYEKIYKAFVRFVYNFKPVDHDYDVNKFNEFIYNNTTVSANLTSNHKIKYLGEDNKVPITNKIYYDYKANANFEEEHRNPSFDDLDDYSDIKNIIISRLIKWANRN